MYWVTLTVGLCLAMKSTAYLGVRTKLITSGLLAENVLMAALTSASRS